MAHEISNITTPLKTWHGRVACDRGDGTLNIHADTETCAVCSPSTICVHEWTEGVDDHGKLVEPAYDVCILCGERQD